MENLISLCMIVKNEEDCLGRVLEGASQFCDEIIIVDTGSTDNTKIIAQKFTNKIYDFKWNDNFSDARNYSFSLATGKYILWLDADDFIPENEINKLKILKKSLFLSKIDVFFFKYQIAFDNFGNSTFTYFRERLLRREKNFTWQGAVHEAIAPAGNLEYLDINIQHLKTKHRDPKRNLKIYNKLLKQKTPFSQRDLYYFGRELYYNKQYNKAITFLNKAIKLNSWAENTLGALEIKAACLTLLNKNPLQTLFESFSYAPPRANFLCKIGDWFVNQNKFDKAIFWFKNALNCEKNYNLGAFIEEDYYNFHPAMQLSLCYFKLNDLKNAVFYNNLAHDFKPFDNIVLERKKFYDNLTNQ